MRVILMLMAFAATMLTGCPAASEARDSVRTGRDVLSEPDVRPFSLPACRIAYQLQPGERRVEMCSISREFLRQGLVQVQTNSEQVDASLVAATPTECIGGPCTLDVIVSFTNRSTVTTTGEIGVRGW